MISLTNTIGKSYHLILAKRTTTYMLDNKLIDPKIQTAFLPSINGCIEHNICMEEIIRHAKIKRLTLHINFFDLEDAFGSKSHDLIKKSFERNYFPQEIIQYITNSYQSSSAKIETKSWTRQSFSFKKGLFQGDPYSPIAFLICFNPIIETLLSKSEMGYNLNGTRFITLPYADDFCAITTHKIKHQKLAREDKKRQLAALEK